MGEEQAELVELQIISSIAGPDTSWRPGQIVSLPPAEAAKWADGVRARYLNPSTSTTEPGPDAAQGHDSDGPDAPPAEKPAQAAVKATGRKKR